MSQCEREMMIEWLILMTTYSRGYLEKATDEELDRIYVMNSRAE